MAPSSQSEDLLDLEQVSLQEASLPPPIQRVMEPGWFTGSSSFVDVLFGFQLYTLLIVLLIFFSGFSDSEVAVMSPDAADLADRLDLSVSSIDMTNTALAMHEEKDCDISGIGKEFFFSF